jgi:predicted nucleic acid-binding protein
VELLSSELSRLEITRALRRAGVDPERVPHFAAQALRGIYLLDVTTTVLARAAAYQTSRLGSLDAIHLASADPFRPDLTHLVTYDHELSHAASDDGFPVSAPG